MNERHIGRTVAIIVIGLLVASTLAGGAYALLTAGDYQRGLDADQAVEDAQWRDWCENVQSQIGPTHAVRSFEDLVNAAEAGELSEPAEKPPTATSAALDRWQAEHEQYVTSNFLLALEGHPGAFAFGMDVLKLILKNAHERKPLGFDRATIRSTARSLDDTVAARC